MESVVEQNDTLRVIVVDDHPLFREGLRSLLSNLPDLTVVGEAEDANQAYELAANARPDLAVVDIALPGGDGFQVAREIMKFAPSCHVLLLTGHSSPKLVAEARSMKVAGFALKSEPATSILEAIRRVGRGEQYFASANNSPPIPEGMTREQRLHTLLPELSNREREIFDLAVAGLSNEQLARQLHISVKTVETHRASINRKLDLHSTADLVRFAAMRGLLAS